MKKTSFILLAGGKGSRMKKDVPKQFLLLSGKPIIMHILDKIDKIEEIKEIIIVCHKDYIDLMNDYIKSYNIATECIVIDGGDTRQDSVFNGLKVTKYESIIIHEAARPFVKASEYQSLINNDKENVIYGRKIPFTVLEGDEKVTGLLKRDSLINVQLPQKFNKELLLNCHEKARNDSLLFTEDASLVYYYTQKYIEVMKGTEYNIKITENVDLLIGEIIYNEYIVGRDL